MTNKLIFLIINQNFGSDIIFHKFWIYRFLIGYSIFATPVNFHGLDLFYCFIGATVPWRVAREEARKEKSITPRFLFEHVSLYEHASLHGLCLTFYYYFLYFRIKRDLWDKRWQRRKYFMFMGLYSVHQRLGRRFPKLHQERKEIGNSSLVGRCFKTYNLKKLLFI